MSPSDIDCSTSLAGHITGFCIIYIYILNLVLFRNVMEPAKIRIHQMRISYEQSVGCGWEFVARSKFVSTSYIAAAIQLSYFCVRL